MKNNILKMAQLALASAIAAMPMTANAELLLSDSFDYSVGDLYNQGNWVKLSTNTAEPIQVANSPLMFAGYQNSAAGKAVVLNGGDNSKAQRLQKGFAADGVTSGTLYYSLLLKVTELSSTNTSKYIISGFTGKNFNGWGDGVGNTSPYAAVSVSPGSAEGKFKLGIAASTSVPTLASEEYNLNQTYLVVVKYDFATKDIVLWVNPSSVSAAPAVTLSGKGSISTTNGVQAVCLYQQGSELAMGNFIVDDVRVATDMADLFDESGSGEQGGEDPSTDAAATVSTTAIDFGSIFQGASATVKVDISATDLTSDLTIASTNQAFTVSPSTIRAAEAMSGTSFDVTFKSSTAGTYGGAIQVMHGNTVLAEVSVSGTSLAVNTPMNYAFVSNGMYEGTLQEDGYYMIESRFGTVTYVDPVSKRFFIQDQVGAVEIDCSMLSGGIPVKIGDKFKKFYTYHSGGKLYLLDGYFSESDITEGTPKEPTAYSLTDILFDPESYWNKLITIENLTFASAGEQFAAASTQAVDADGKSVSVRPFDGTDLIGSIIPENGSVTGILVSKTGNAIWPRSLADVEGAEIVEESALEISQKLDFSGVAAPINTDTRFATFTVKTNGLEKPVSIWLGGANRGMYSLSTEVIPAGTGTYEVVVTYHPTAIGAHKAMVNFDATPTELSASYALSSKAYDPDHLPTLTVPSTVEQFSAAPGASDQKSIVISSANMFDYGTITVESQSTPGAFTINSSSFYYNVDANITVTFRPLEAGNYTATLKVSAPMAQDRYIYLTGVSEGDTPVSPTEGNELHLDASAPLTLLIENFDSAVKNQPLELSGWNNVAVTGTRAWWGYTFAEDGNGAAKVTAYDSMMNNDEPCEMLLVTPALDFKNAASKVFTCRIMGDFLPSDGTGRPIDVLYIEDEEYMEALDGMNIPASDDLDKEWVDYVIDFDGLDLADTFFIGFRLRSERGRNNSSVYYVDNVSWGRTDIPQIKLDIPGIQFEGTVGQTTASEAISVTGRNLTDNISLKVSGANASKFSTSVATLPADGGTFHINFTPEEIGVHEAYIELSSAGAPTILLPVAALGTDLSGIESISSTLSGSHSIYNLQGIRVGSADRTDRLPAGIYIVDGKVVYLK